MCGIWAIIGVNNIDKEYVRSKLHLLDSLKDRGPDKTTFYTNHPIIFGFQRLAIHDLSVLGDQPFTMNYKNRDGKMCQATLICNGEIYNYKELYEEFNFQNVKSDSDCEVILHLWAKFMDIELVLLYLKGEFAFIIEVCELEKQKIDVFICRDPFGIRPLFMNRENENGNIILGSTLYSTGISNDLGYHNGSPVLPGTYIHISDTYLEKEYYHSPSFYSAIKTPDNFKLTKLFINAVKKRLDSDRPIGITLSGGLDSSLVCAVATKILGKKLKTFSVGLPNSVDLMYAKICAEHLKTEHHECTFTIEEALSTTDEVIHILESYDITTIRASIWQLLVAKLISQTSDVKVILNGDGSDELLMGYKENYFSPSHKESFDNVTVRLKEIFMYDGLRMDRCISSQGLEARVAFLDVDFVDYVRTISPEFMVPIKGKRMEKFMIRQAFKELYPDILPDEILFRHKEAFSDGVSTKDSERSWFDIIRDHFEQKVSDEEFNNRSTEYDSCPSKEAYYYKKVFTDKFGPNYDVINGYWLPNWVDTKEPSARTLNID